MGSPNIAAEEAAHLAGIGGHSPEVPTSILSRDASGVLVGQVGLRVSKYGTSGLDWLFKYLGDRLKSEATKKYSGVLARTTAGVIVIAAFLALRGRASRDLTVGAAYEQLTAICDYGEQQIRKTIGV